ncbi:hypothetical protein NA57DRAFT_51244 [Rhizodiscina lignyota]|uniref:N-acetyltransferase domain-containing protein n=1 Tax=Rhizodiscina lignyota TaxID=1504668 RepID=A0A9P4ITY7_9PEZI|nr:hypothetical protein NA57DRAFT_51244 [Rhizodiscina lignyota]
MAFFIVRTISVKWYHVCPTNNEQPEDIHLPPPPIRDSSPSSSTTAVSIAPSERETFYFAPVLHTGRLTLTLWNGNEENLKLFLGTFTSPHTKEHVGELPVKTLEDAKRLIDTTTLGHKVLSGKKAPGAAMYILRLGRNNPNGEAIGHIELVQRNSERLPDVGYALIGSKYANTGYMTEAAKEVLRYWRDDCGIRDIQILTAANSRPSYRIPEKLGFLREADLEVGKGRKLRVYITPGSIPPKTVKAFTFFGDGSQFLD